MGGMGGDGQVAAGQFMLALRPGLDPRQFVADRVVDCLFLPDFVMTAPVLVE
jgi:hypothetical protein